MNEIILTLHIGANNDYVTRDEYEEAVHDETRALMGDSYDAGYKVGEILRENPDVTLCALVYGEGEELEKVRKAVEEAFRKEAEDNIDSDWPAVHLTKANLIDILRELGADTVNALVAEAFG